VHPTPVYETIVMGIVTVVLWRLRHKLRPGNLFALWAVLAGLERFLIEFIRRNDEVVAGLTQPQLISLAMVLLGGAWLATHWGPAHPSPAPAKPAPRTRAARQRA
jgi:phosphatidylglycerol:prolipoprotein diacylglycerol transferase